MTPEKLIEECEKLIKFYVDELYHESLTNKRRELLLDCILNDKPINYRRINSTDDFEDLLQGVVLECYNFQKDYNETWSKNPYYVINCIVIKYVYPAKLHKVDLIWDNNLINLII